MESSKFRQSPDARITRIETACEQEKRVHPAGNAAVAGSRLKSLLHERVVLKAAVSIR